MKETPESVDRHPGRPWARRLQVCALCCVFVIASTWALLSGRYDKKPPPAWSWVPMTAGSIEGAGTASDLEVVSGPSAQLRESVSGSDVESQSPRRTILNIVDAVSGGTIGDGVVAVIGSQASVAQDAHGVWVLSRQHEDPEIEWDVVEVTSTGYLTERFCIGAEPSPPSVALALRRTMAWSLTLVDTTGQPLQGAVIELQEVGGRGSKIVTGPADSFGRTSIHAPSGRYIPKVIEPVGLVPVAAEPHESGYVVPADDVRITLGHLRVAAVQVLGDEVLGGYMEKPFPLSMAVGAYMSEASRLEADLAAKWPGIIASSTIPQAGQMRVKARVLTRHHGIVEHDCAYRDAVGFVPERVRLSAASQEMVGVIEVDAKNFGGEPWMNHPMFLVVTDKVSGKSVNRDARNAVVHVPFGRIHVQAMQPGIEAWVDVAPSSVAIGPGNRYAKIYVQAREKLAQKRLRVFIYNEGLIEEYRGMVRVLDNEQAIGQWSIDRDGAEVWVPEREIAIEGVVHSAGSNRRVRASMSSSAARELRVILR